jgi:hypothetical protein
MMKTQKKSKASDEPEIKQLTLRLPLDGWKRLAHVAIDEDISIQAFIVRAINAELVRKKIQPIEVND